MAYNEDNGKQLTATERLAFSIRLQAYTRVAMILMPFLMTILGWIGNNVYTEMKAISKNQDEARLAALTTLGEIRLSLALTDSTTKALGARLDDTTRILNSRIDQLSNWSQKNANEIDKIKESVYPLLTRGSPH